MELNLKYNPFDLYKKDIEEVLDIHKYDSKMATRIKLLLPLMIEYYGHEYKDIIVDTFKKTPIFETQQGQTMLDIYNKCRVDNLIENKNGVASVSDEELKVAAGVYGSIPILAKTQNGIEVLGKNELIGYTSLGKDMLDLSLIIHEMSHSIKSRNNEYTIASENGEDFLVTRTGISRKISRLTQQDNKFIIEDLEEINIGLEEGINTYDEENIINKVLLQDMSLVPEDIKGFLNNLKEEAKTNESYVKTGRYSVSGYAVVKSIANALLKQGNLKHTIRKDQILGTAQTEKKYDERTENSNNTWKILNSRVTDVINDLYQMFRSFDVQGWKNSVRKDTGQTNIDHLVKTNNQIHQQIDEYIQKTQLEKKHEE